MKFRISSLVLSLLLTGCVTTPASNGEYYSDQDLISAGGVQLRGNDIVGIISGNTLYGQYLDPTKPDPKIQEPTKAGDVEVERRWVEFVSNDGRVAYYNFQQLIQGSWQLKTDLICFNYKMEIPQPENCFVVYGLDNKHYFISTRQQTVGQVVTVILGRKNGNVEGFELK